MSRQGIPSGAYSRLPDERDRTFRHRSIDAAIAALEVAMASGHRHYSFVLYDERWDPARGDPRFEELIAQMKADVDAQRARVERIEAEDDFEAALQLALRRSRSD